MGVMSLHTALYDDHLAMGARMTDFGGYSMPLHYQTGTLAEHRAVREHVGIFDVSHLGTVLLEGPEAFGKIQSTLTNDLSQIEYGRTQYTHLLAEDGSVIDDIVILWVAPETFHVMPNASNTSDVVKQLGGRDITRDRVVVAVQGPQSIAFLEHIYGPNFPVKRGCVGVREIHGSAVFVSGTGYTGEKGVEIVAPAEIGSQLFQELCGAGAVACGLGARDTLRLEAGLPLHGHELGQGITPLMANLEWVIAFDKGEFPGRSALVAQRQAGVRTRLFGLVTNGRQPLRAGDKVVDQSSGEQRGVVTSGGFSPALVRGIGLALLEVGDNSRLKVLRGDQDLPVKLHPYPFHRHPLEAHA